MASSSATILTMGVTSVDAWWLKAQLAVGILNAKAADRALTAVEESDPNGLGKHCAAYRTVLKRFKQPEGKPPLSPVQAWQQGLYEHLRNLPNQNPVRYDRRTVARFLASQTLTDWTPVQLSQELLDRSEKQEWAAKGTTSIQVADEQLTLSGSCGLCLPISGADVAIKVDVELPAAGATFGLRARQASGGQGYVAEISAAGKVSIWISGPPPSSEPVLLARTTLREALLGRVAATFTVIDQELMLRVGGKQVLSASNDALTAGSVGLKVRDGQVVFRNLEVKVLDTPVQAQ